jgi:hypothetical protein
MMKEFFELALHAEDERGKSVSLVPDRAGIRGIDFDPLERRTNGRHSIRATTHQSSSG